MSSLDQVLARANEEAARRPAHALIVQIERLRAAKVGHILKGGLQPEGYGRACGYVEALDEVLRLLGQGQKGRP